LLLLRLWCLPVDQDVARHWDVVVLQAIRSTRPVNLPKPVQLALTIGSFKDMHQIVQQHRLTCATSGISCTGNHGNCFASCLCSACYHRSIHGAIYA
jgi:hypothetical protein